MTGHCLKVNQEPGSGVQWIERLPTMHKSPSAPYALGVVVHPCHLST